MLSAITFLDYICITCGNRVLHLVLNNVEEHVHSVLAVFMHIASRTARWTHVKCELQSMPMVSMTFFVKSDSSSISNEMGALSNCSADVL